MNGAATVDHHAHVRLDGIEDDVQRIETSVTRHRDAIDEMKLSMTGVRHDLGVLKWIGGVIATGVVGILLSLVASKVGLRLP